MKVLNANEGFDMRAGNVKKVLRNVPIRERSLRVDKRLPLKPSPSANVKSWN